MPRSKLSKDEIKRRADRAEGKPESKSGAKKSAGSGKGARGEDGRFLPGNRFWEARSTAGPKPLFTDPEKLWQCCVEYFEWVDENPLFEDKLVTFQGMAKHEPSAKMRAMTISGLCVFLDIGVSTWGEWRDRPDMAAVVARVEAVIREQKFTGAAADLLNPNIIARDLGLADKSELSGRDGGPIETRELSGNDLGRRIAFALAQAVRGGSDGNSSGA